MLYQEVRGTRTETVFRYPSGLESVFHFIGIALGLGGLGIFWHFAAGPTDYVDVFSWGVGVAFLVFWGISRLWEQRALIIRPLKKRLTFLRRTPFRDEEVAFRFKELQSVFLEVPTSPHGFNPAREFDLCILTKAGLKVYLGTAVREAATNQARRLSQLIQIPCQWSPHSG